MNTPAHMALGLAVLGRAGRGGDWLAILGGAILPDVAYFLGWGGTRLPLMADVFNSLPLWALALAVAWAAGWRRVALFAGAALLHVLTDLPLHAGDAHAHFWPFTDRVFASPVSFWDADHHGRIAGVGEGVLFVACLAAIWRRLDAPWQRALAAAFGAVYAATFVHFVGHAWAGVHWAVW